MRSPSLIWSSLALVAYGAVGPAVHAEPTVPVKPLATLATNPIPSNEHVAQPAPLKIEAPAARSLASDKAPAPPAAVQSAPLPPGAPAIILSEKMPAPPRILPGSPNPKAAAKGNPTAKGKPADARGKNGIDAAAREMMETEAQEHEHEKMDPNESLTGYFWRKSDDAFHNGEYERAVALHRAIEIADPTDTENYGVGAWLLWSMDRKAEGLEWIERGLKANPGDVEMWDEAGQHYDFQKLLPQAKDAYQRAVQLLPKDDKNQMLRRRLAHAAEKAGDWKLATATWTSLVQDFPQEVVNKNNLARVQKEAAAPTATVMKGSLLFLGALATLLLPLAVRRRRPQLVPCPAGRACSGR